MDVTHSNEQPTPWQRLTDLLKEDRRDLLVLLVYVLLNGLLMLAVPLAAQALVNTIAAGVFLQPLVVLSLLLLGALLFVGCIRLLKLTLIEILQQRIFVRIAMHLAYRLPRISSSAVQGKYLPELANRFFDVMTIQKTWSKILLDGPSAALQILVGLTLLAFYSPLLLAFDVILILLIVGVIFGLGVNGLKTSIRESVQKYKVAGWLEELGRCNVSFKLAGIPDFTLDKTDSLVQSYLAERRAHFRIIFRHAAGTYLLYALASAGILAIGGWLVIERQLTLGQLVASEIIVVGVLAALERLTRLIELFYDLLTGVDKIGHVIDLPLDSPDGRLQLEQTNPAGIAVELREVRFSYEGGAPILGGITLEWPPGERVGLVGDSGAGKTTLAYLLCDLLEPSHGMISLNGIDSRDIDLKCIQRWVAYAGHSGQIFEGTIEENVTLGREWLTHQDVRRALEFTELDRDIVRFPDGKQTRLVSEGRNLSFGQRQRLMIARAIVDQPQFLILDETLAAIEGDARQRILARLVDPKNPWTLLVITHDPLVLKAMNRVMVMETGGIAEDAPLAELLNRNAPVINRLFPDLMRKG